MANAPYRKLSCYIIIQNIVISVSPLSGNWTLWNLYCKHKSYQTNQVGSGNSCRWKHKTMVTSGVFWKFTWRKKEFFLYRSNNICTLKQFLSLNWNNPKNNEERLEGLKITKLCCLTWMISSLAIYLSGLRKEFKLSANIKYAVPLHDTCIPVVIFLRLM